MLFEFENRYSITSSRMSSLTTSPLDCASIHASLNVSSNSISSKTTHSFFLTNFRKHHCLSVQSLCPTTFVAMQFLSTSKDFFTLNRRGISNTEAFSGVYKTKKSSNSLYKELSGKVLCLHLNEVL